MSRCVGTAERTMQDERRIRSKKISFGGCGFLGVYHAGVGQSVCDHAPHLFSEFAGFYGASAGAITAVCAACRSDPMEAYKWVKKTFEASRKHYLGMLHPTFDLYARLRAFLEDFLPKNAHRLCRNKVKISLTTLSDSGLPVNWLVSNFNTRKELINAIIASSFIPGYAGVKDLPKFRGKRCFDGGFSSNIPHLSDPDVISVSPFSGSCDISPQESCYPVMLQICDQPIQITPQNMHRLAKSLCPTSWEELELLFYQGYEDAKRFFTKEGFFPKPEVASLPLATPTPVETDATPTPVETIDESPSEYFSVCSHSRSQSMVVFSNADFMSCVDEEEEDRDILDMVPSRRPSCIQFDVPRPSMFSTILQPPIDAAKLSMKSLSRVVQFVTPTRIPTALYNSLTSPTHDEGTWEHQLSAGHGGLMGHMLSTLTSSVATF